MARGTSPPRVGAAAALRGCRPLYDPQAEAIGDRYGIGSTSDRTGDSVLVALNRKTAREVARYQPLPLDTHRRAWPSCIR